MTVQNDKKRDISLSKIRFMRNIKLFFDVILAIIALAVLMIPMLIILLFIIFDSKGSPFFLQERLGMNGKPFRIIKFRTMIVNAENIGSKMRVDGENDFRITKVGRFLRKTSLDELPQLINIIKGDMAIVGPRPCLTYHPYQGMENFPEWSKDRFLVRPGMTGLAQVKIRNAVPWDERMKYDIEYVHNMSLWLDIKLIIQTVSRVFKPENMY